MRSILHQSNTDLLREVDQLLSRIPEVHVPIELTPYYNWVLDHGRTLRSRIEQNLEDLRITNDDILEEVLSNTQEVTRSFRLYNQHFVGPVFRSLPSDRLCLSLLNWLHKAHQQTIGLPACISDGEFSVLPYPPFPTVYLMPPSAQHGILYLPLFFHEFGHVLYTRQKTELDDLVAELQKGIENLLRPVSQRNDQYSEAEQTRHKTIVETWYSWAQELFCDAVGLVIGGPCFINALLFYFRMTGKEMFHQSAENLARSTHPVMWLRVRLISDRARRLGLTKEADLLEHEWDSVASAMHVNEDYYGFYDPQFLPLVRQTIEDMITEAEPLHFTHEDLSQQESSPNPPSPVHLLNTAWTKFLSNPETYLSWEESVIATFLNSV